MKQCRMDCIHAEACRRFADNDTYWNIGDCPIYKPTADVVPKSEVERLQEDVDRLNEINEGLVRELSELRKQIELDKRSQEIDKIVRRRLGDFL